MRCCHPSGTTALQRWSVAPRAPSQQPPAPAGGLPGCWPSGRRRLPVKQDTDRCDGGSNPSQPTTFSMSAKLNRSSARLLTGSQQVRILPQTPDRCDNPIRTSVAQLAEQRSPKPQVEGSSPSWRASFTSVSSAGRAPPLQGGCRRFESVHRRPFLLFV